MNGGRVEQVGSPLDLYEKPANLFVAGFIGSPKMNFLPGKVIGASDGQAQVEITGLMPLSVPVARLPKVGEAVTLGIRPEHLTVGEGTGSVWNGRALVVERLGGETYLHMTGPGTDPLVIRQPGTLAVKVGEAVSVTVPPAVCHLFDAEGQAL